MYAPLGLDELALEKADLLGIVELDYVGRPADAARVERADHEHVRVPLEHHVRVVGEPDGAVPGFLAAVVVEHRLVPALVGLRAPWRGS
jgi:hypothetical protein